MRVAMALPFQGRIARSASPPCGSGAIAVHGLIAAEKDRGADPLGHGPRMFNDLCPAIPLLAVGPRREPGHHGGAHIAQAARELGVTQARHPPAPMVRAVKSVWSYRLRIMAFSMRVSSSAPNVM